MRKLTVKNFSVIKEAELDFNGINVIIGPQASGKSLLCKLASFNLDTISMAVDAIADETALKTFKQQVKDSFNQWFPLDAWGKGKFEINYENGPFSVSFTRTSYSGALGDKVRLTLCHNFCTTYEEALRDVRNLKERTKSKKRMEEEDLRPWETRDIASKRISSLFNGSQPLSQLYIPAGRAFFTTYSKAIAVFESGSLDPVTSRFGKMVEWILDDRVYVPERNKTALRMFEEIQNRILKGHLVRKKGTLRFETEDGRNLALAQLSSGTQEALPLLRALRFALVGPPNRTVFAEEPEVHLFPSAQMEIVRLFCWLANASKQKSCWVITTHSPYILSAFNNMIEAGQIARTKPELKDKVAKIIPEQYWIKEGDFKAYAIEGGILKSIVAEDTGLVSANYLDQVSETIGVEFDELLRLGYVEA